MMEINLLRRYPKGKRNVSKRAHAKTEEHVRISRQYGCEYFDGPREYGYGGYRYDGRWQPIAEDMVAHFARGQASATLLLAGLTLGFISAALIVST